MRKMIIAARFLESDTNKSAEWRVRSGRYVVGGKKMKMKPWLYTLGIAAALLFFGTRIKLQTDLSRTASMVYGRS